MNPQRNRKALILARQCCEAFKRFFKIFLNGLRQLIGNTLCQSIAHIHILTADLNVHDCYFGYMPTPKISST